MFIKPAKWCDDNFNVILSSEAIWHLYIHRQNWFWNREAGGQLFGHLEDTKFTVNFATGPRKEDVRCRHGYVGNRNEEQKEIDNFLKKDVFYLGDWHTHPEKHPTPSSRDIETSNDCFRKSTHAMPGYIMIIVGKSEYVHNWFVGITSKTGTRNLKFV